MTEEHVVRIKTARLRENRNLITFEKWTRDEYVSSHMMVVDDQGRAQRELINSEYNFRLPPTNDLTVIDGKAIVYSGVRDGYGNKLIRIEFDVQELEQ